MKVVFSPKLNGPFDYGGLAEVAEFLGVSKQTIVNWRNREKNFPEPVAVLRATPIWRMCDIRDWTKTVDDGAR